MRYMDVQAELAETGFILRGGFIPGPDDAVPGIDGNTDAVVIVVGNAGSDMWRRFAASRSPARRRNDANPLNDWTVEVLEPIAAGLGARIHYPFERPYHPFQRWAMKADSVWPSPLGPLIHPEFGLWHAYRAALVFEPGFALEEKQQVQNPCESCPHRKCLDACPVDAYSAGHYDVPTCIRHIAEPRGRTCVDRHCLARRACPVGHEYTYEPTHAAFHMSRFLTSAQKRDVVELPR